MLSAILYGLGTMVGYGTANAIARIPARKISPMKIILFRGIIISILFLIPVIISTPAYTIKDIIITALISFLGYLAVILFYFGIKHGKVGIVAPISHSYPLLTIILAVIFFNEKLTVSRISSFLLILIGLFLLSVDIRQINRFKLTSGAMFALLAMILWGFSFFIWKIPSLVLGPLLSTFILEVTNIPYAAVHMGIKKVKFDLPSKRILLFIFLGAILGAFGTFSYMKGINTNDVSIVAAVSAAAPLMTIIWSRILFKERLTKTQYAAALMTIIGIVILSL